VGAPRITQRFEFRSFERFIQLHYEDTNVLRSQQKGDGEIADGFIAELVGKHVRLVGRYRADGVSHRIADELCCAIDIHPALIWPEWVSEEDPTTQQGATHE
jgi:hypothetical protein